MSQADQTIDLAPGRTVTVVPWCAAVVWAGSFAVERLPADTAEPDRDLAYLVAAARRAVKGWDGFGAPFSADALEHALRRSPTLAAAFLNRYIVAGRAAEAAWLAEGNGSPPAPSGAGAAASSSAAAAES